MVTSIKRRGHLTTEEVRERLASYKEPTTTDELYDFGKMLITETLDRVKSLDNKAAAVAAYSVGLITLLVSTRLSWSGGLHPWAAGLPLCGGVAAFFAALYAVRALVLKRYNWFSENEWMERDCLADRDRLRRYHVLAMWKVLGSHNLVCETKASRITTAQWLLLAAAVILVLSLGDVLAVRLFVGFII
jgi:hypothetical protein